MPQQSQKYQVNQYRIANILNWVDSGDIAVPEIQRPFVWSKIKVRNLLDSLYRGFPVGYLIVWKNPDVKLKSGERSYGKKILIDGQQRITALEAAVLGKQVTNKEYKAENIKIAFHPVKEKFEVQNPAILKDPAWIPDIAPIMVDSARIIQIVREYVSKNRKADEIAVEDTVQKLRGIKAADIGYVELESDLEIDTVTTIFERVNSSGVRLSKADFAMSKIASYDDLGPNLRKLVDYFCHLAVAPEFYPHLKKDDGFRADYLDKIVWLKDESDDLYDPTYIDLLRVALIDGFERGRMGDFVSLLSGRNFETREFEKEIQKKTFDGLEGSLLRFVDETNFKRFLMIIRSAGFISSSMIKSKNALNFAYATYLKLKRLYVPQAEIESFVRKWFVMSVLTGRYSSSIETGFDADIKSIVADHRSHLKFVEDTKLSGAFWDVELVSEMNKSITSSPLLSVFYAAQVKSNDKGFLSTAITVRDMIQERGDTHHIFPKAYVKKMYNSRNDYNNIANFVYTQSEINIGIKDKPPFEYFGEIRNQCSGGPLRHGGITDMKELKSNLRQNCVPESVFKMSIEHYHSFLGQRKRLMAEKIKTYYESL